MAGKKILMLVGEFSEEYEIFVFEQAMHAVGHHVDVVCPDKKAGEVIKTSLHPGCSPTPISPPRCATISSTPSAPFSRA